MSNPGNHEPEWYSAVKFRAALESLGFEVVRGLTIPAEEELSSFELLIIPVPNQQNLTQGTFLENAKDLMFRGANLLIFLDAGTPPYINDLTQEFGVEVHGGSVAYPGLREDPGAFNIIDIGHNHPVTADIGAIRVNWSAPMTMSPPKLDAKVHVLAFAPDEVVASRTTTPGPYAYAVAVEYGNGKIVIAADQSPFQGQGKAGNFVASTLDWLATSDTAGAASPGQQEPPGRGKPEQGNQRFEPQINLDEAKRQEDLLRKQEELRRISGQGNQVQAGQQGLGLLDPSNPLGKNLPTRGFFTNSPAGAFSDIDSFFDPTSLAVVGIILTLLATSLSLVKGS